MADLIPFVGGPWHGEARRAREFSWKVTGLIKDVLDGATNKITEIGDPPRYLGNNQYDAYVSNVSYSTYRLRTYNGRDYAVWEGLDEFPMANIVIASFETPNAARMREEKERQVRYDYKKAVEGSGQSLLASCIQKHELIDRTPDATAVIADAEQAENQCWKIYKHNKKRLEKYDGEPPLLKEPYRG